MAARHAQWSTVAAIWPRLCAPAAHPGGHATRAGMLEFDAVERVAELGYEGWKGGIAAWLGSSS